MTPILQTLIPLAKRHGTKQATDFTQGNDCISGSPGDELDAFLSNQGFDPTTMEAADRDLLYDAYLDGWDSFFRQRLSLQSVPSDSAGLLEEAKRVLLECSLALDAEGHGDSQHNCRGCKAHDDAVSLLAKFNA